MKFISIVLLFSVVLLGGCAKLLPEIPDTKNGVSVYHNTQPPYYGASSDRTVNLKNNEMARNPTWEELVRFLNLDDTDKGAYGFGLWVCAEFANELHDNAERAGIKAAWVAVEFVGDDEGHAFNAFETTDRGLVFVDCTGAVPTDTVPITSVDTGGIENEPPSPTDKDRIAYVEIGEEYGLIFLEYALSPEYGFYKDYKKERGNIYAWLEEYNEAVMEFNQKKEIFNSKVKAYNMLSAEYELWVGGRTVINDPDEYAELSRMYDELEVMRLELELEGVELDIEGAQIMQERIDIEEEFDRLGWYNATSPGIISSVEIYW